jgi:uncharacterized protein
MGGIEMVNGPAIIDTDTHFAEPRDLWTRAMPKKFADQTLNIRFNEQFNSEWWYIGDNPVSPAWFGCTWGSGVPYPGSPATQDKCNPATTVQSERVAWMDQAGIRAAVLYPNIGGLRPSNFLALDPEVANWHCSVYNDYQLEFAQAAPGRFIPMIVVPFWDMPAAVAEIERLGGQGFGGIVMTNVPQYHKQPYLADPHWNPMWQACVEQGLSVSFHIASGDVSDMGGPERAKHDPPGAQLGRAVFPMIDNGKYVADLLLSGVLARYPDLKFVSVESGVGWVPFMLEGVDYHFKRALPREDQRPFGDMLPSDLFRRQVYVNYWFEDLQDWHLEAIGDGHIIFETDFPHPTCLSPEDVTAVAEQLRHRHPEELVEKILWRNAEELYHLEPSTATTAG